MENNIKKCKKTYICAKENHDYIHNFDKTQDPENQNQIQNPLRERLLTKK